MKIGILAIQGDFAEHIVMLKRIGVQTAEVRLPAHLAGLDGLMMPGGESTTIGKLAVDFACWNRCVNLQVYAIWGTCAGAIFLSKDARRNQPLLGIMDIIVQRNAFGRQVDSLKEEILSSLNWLQAGLTTPSSSAPRSSNLFTEMQK